MAKHPYLGILALILALPLQSFAHPRQLEALDRGLVVSNVGASGMLVSWRLLGTEDSGTEFNLYRDGEKIASIGSTAGTNYLDKDGTVSSKYAVAAVVNKKEDAKRESSIVLDSTVSYGGQSFPYKVLKLDAPECPPSLDGDTCTYQPSDMSAADLDGDGQYELILKWDPSNSKDNSMNGFTSPTLIDAYRLDGKKLWRVNMGWNIRSGAHYTQFQVFDYDGDGKAEMIVKTADGTIDGLGKVIGDADKNYLDTNGRPMSGPEYLSVFRGVDGAVITTVDYVPSRDIRELGREDTVAGTTWGDTYGNRGERYLAATAYLDGIHPSAIFARGYYTAAYVVAYDFDGKNLKQRWFHKSETPGKGLYGQGNHNIFTGDIDGDGLDEIIYGAAALKPDGTLLYSTGLWHGDAGHLGDLDPDHPGLEFFGVHERGDRAKYMDELRGADGSILFGTPQPEEYVDNGRGMAADIDSSYRGYEFWSSKNKTVRTVKGKFIDSTTYTVKPTSEWDDGDRTYPANFRIYFDADLQDELLDDAQIFKYNSKDKKMNVYFDGQKALNLLGCNGTKATPLLVADLFGDWREEAVLRTENDPSRIYIVSTPVTTPYRVYTLMHDAVYRMAIAWQNTAYNQPPHLGYFLPDMVKKLQKPAVYTVGENEYVMPPDAFLEKTGKGSENQTVSLGKAIDEIGYSYMFCTGVNVEGLPAGVTAKVDSAANTVTISGMPTKVGKFKFTVATVGSKAENVSLKGEIVVTDTSVVDAAKLAEGKGAVGQESEGYIGEGYYDFENSTSSFATWKVVSNADAMTTMGIRYANGDEISRDMVLVVNGEEIGTIKMDTTGDWSAWEVVSVDIELNKGENKITLKSTIDKGGPDVDALLFDIGGVKAVEEHTTPLPSVARPNAGFFYRPATGTLFTDVSGFAEVLFYDVSGTLRSSVSAFVSAGTTVLAPDHGLLPKGMYVVKVKFDGITKQKGLFKY